MDGCSEQRTDQGNVQSAAVESGMIRTAHNAGREELTQERLRELMTYDPETGTFTRIQPKKGTIGGSRKRNVGADHSRGYISIGVEGKRYLAHRLAWLFIYGEIPKCIDHIDGNKKNNRISNLRKATHADNGANRGKTKRNTSGYKGVFRHKCGNKWEAKIMTEGKIFYLGVFQKRKEAAAAYDRAAKEVHGDFMRPNIDESESL